MKNYDLTEWCLSNWGTITCIGIHWGGKMEWICSRLNDRLQLWHKTAASVYGSRGSPSIYSKAEWWLMEWTGNVKMSYFKEPIWEFRTIERVPASDKERVLELKASFGLPIPKKDRDRIFSQVGLQLKSY